MTLPENSSADYTLLPSELAEMLATPVEARQRRWSRDRPARPTR